METINPAEQAHSGIGRNSGSTEAVKATGVYTIECVRDGEVVWTDTVQNLVTTAGKNDLLDKYLAGSTYTAAWYLGLVDGGTAPTYAAADTSASHAGWTESVAYSNANRPTPSWGTASAGSKASTATAFNINATATIAGCFLISNSTKAGTAGTLYSCGSFSGGNKAVTSGDTLNVTYTASA